MFGEVKGWLYPNNYFKDGVIPSKMDDFFLIVEKSNTIDTPLKTRVRDLLISSASTVDYVGENGLFTTTTTGNTEDGNDGIVLNDDGGGFVTLITTPHPSDSSGNYYKKWRGTAIFPVSALMIDADFGTVWASSARTFGGRVAYFDITDFTPDVGNIFVIDWKISVA